MSVKATTSPEIAVRYLFGKASLLGGGVYLGFLIISALFNLGFRGTMIHLTFEQLTTLWLVVLFFQVWPWVILARSPEWFYTRSVPPATIFKLFWREYMIGWAGGMTLMVSSLFFPLLFWKMSSNIPIHALSYLMGMPVLLSLLLATYSLNPRLAARSFGLILLILTIFNSLPFNSNIPILIFWFYIFGLYIQLDKYQNDISSWLLESHSQMIHTSPSLSSGFGKWILQTAEAARLYNRIWILPLILGSGFLLLRSFKYPISEYGSLGHVIVWAILPACALLIASIRFTVGFGHSEFLMSRPLNRWCLYFYNYLVQGFCLGLLLLLILFLNQQLPLKPYLNWAAIGWSFLYIWLAGEVGGMLLLVLFVLELMWIPTLIPSFIFNLHTTGWFGLGLLASACFFRLWDMIHFQRQELPKRGNLGQVMLNVTRSYGVPLLVGGLAIGMTIRANPVTYYLKQTRINSWERWKVSLNVLETVYRVPNHPRQHWLVMPDIIGREPTHVYPVLIRALKLLQQNPEDQQGFLLMAKAFLNDRMGAGLSGNYIRLAKSRSQDMAVVRYWLEKANSLRLSSDYLYVQSILETLEGNHEKAIRTAEHAAMSSHSPLHWLHLAHLYADRQNDKAESAFLKAADLNKQNTGVYWIQLGNFYWRQQYPEKAINAYQRAIQQEHREYTWQTCQKVQELLAKKDVFAANFRQAWLLCRQQYPLYLSPLNDFQKWYQSQVGQYITHLPERLDTSLASWFPAGNMDNDYETGVDSQVSHQGGNSGYVKVFSHDREKFATLMQVINAHQYRGKRLRFSAYVKAEEIMGWAGLWMRIDGSQNEELGFDNMGERPIQGTHEWQPYEVVLDVPKNAERIAFGILLSQKGTVWIDNVKFEMVDSITPTTHLSLPLEPVNSGFED